MKSERRPRYGGSAEPIAQGRAVSDRDRRRRRQCRRRLGEFVGHAGECGGSRQAASVTRWSHPRGWRPGPRRIPGLARRTHHHDPVDPDAVGGNGRVHRAVPWLLQWTHRRRDRPARGRELRVRQPERDAAAGLRRGAPQRTSSRQDTDWFAYKLSEPKSQAAVAASADRAAPASTGTRPTSR